MKILLADDHDLVRDALVALVLRDEPHAVVKTADSLTKALEILEADKGYDVVVLDLRMPGMTGVDDVKKVMRLVPEAPVVMMSGVANQVEIEAAFDAGVRGFLPKTMAGKALVNALRLVMAGERYVPSSLFEKPAKGHTVGGAPELSAREADTLKQLFLGRSNKEIARALGIQETTVKLHIRNLCAKLGAKNRTDVVVKAVQAGLGDL